MPLSSRPKLGLSLLLLLVGSVLLGGCRKEPEGVTVRFWAMGREAEVVSGLISEFEAENPGIHVDVQNIPWTAAHEKLLTAFAADGLPDVCQLGNTWIPEFAELNTLVPLQPYVAQSKVVDPADYFQGIWDTNVVHEELVGVPWYVDTRLLYYRKDLLAQAGYDHPPRTWEEWTQMMAAIKMMQGPKRYAVLMPIIAHPPLACGAMNPKGADELIENVLDKLHLTPLLKIKPLFGQLMDKSLWFTPWPSIQNVSGQPSIALPVHVTDAGLPLGIQAAGRPGDEETLLSLAAQMEKISGWLKRRAPLMVP